MFLPADIPNGRRDGTSFGTSDKTLVLTERDAKDGNLHVAERRRRGSSPRNLRTELTDTVLIVVMCAVLLGSLVKVSTREIPAAIRTRGST